MAMQPMADRRGDRPRLLHHEAPTAPNAAPGAPRRRHGAQRGAGHSAPAAHHGERRTTAASAAHGSRAARPGGGWRGPQRVARGHGPPTGLALRGEGEIRWRQTVGAHCAPTGCLAASAGFGAEPQGLVAIMFIWNL